jgi:outer membrane protein assembly factor BamB
MHARRRDVRDTSPVVGHARPVVIDLDSVGETSSRGRWPARRVTRRVLPAAVALVLLTLGGSATPLPGLRPVLTTESATGVFTLGPSALFATESDAAPGRSSIRRYALDQRSTTWVTRLPHRVEELDLAAPANVLVAGSVNSTQPSLATSMRATFIDSDTGRVLWRTTSDDAVLRLAGTSALMASSADSEPVVQRVDLRTGTVLWSRPFDPTGHLDVGGPAGGDPSRVVTVDQRGTVRTYAFADGEVLATADLGAAPTLDDDGLDDVVQVHTIGDRLYLARRDSGSPSLTAFRLDDLQQLWRRTSIPVGYPTWCGAYVCITTASGMTVIDSIDGSPRWSDSRWLLGYDTRAVGMPGPPRLAAIDSQQDPEHALLDPASGRVLSLLGRSTYVGTVLLRSDITRIGRTWVQIPGPSGEVRTVGHLDTVAPARCDAAANHLACPAPTGRTTVWRVPSN